MAVQAASHFLLLIVYLNGKKVERKPSDRRVFFTTPKEYQQILESTAREDRKGKTIIKIADEIYRKTKKKIQRS